MHITEQSPLMASLWGQASVESIKKAVGEDAYKELVKRYGRGMFAKRGSGVAWDVVVQEAINKGLLPETANPSDVADALCGERVLWHPMNPDVDLDTVIPVVTAEVETDPVWKSMKTGKKAIIQSIVGKYVMMPRALKWICQQRKQRICLAAPQDEDLGGWLT